MSFATATKRPGRYDADFYRDQLDVSARSAHVVVPFLVDLLEPGSVVDVGCGAGTWLAAFIDAGVTDVLGVDGGDLTPELLRIPADLHRTADLSEPFVPPQRFDLAMSLEVAEHLDERHAQRFVDSLVACAPVVLFGAAIPGQGGTGHVNEQWQTYWAQLFRTKGYVALDCVRPRFWDDAEVASYYAQNTLLYADERIVESHPGLRRAAAEATSGPLDLVHPRLFERRIAHPVLRTVAGWIPEGTKNKVTRRLRSRSEFFRRV